MASDIVDKLCQSVAAKLDGKVIGTFSGEHLKENYHMQLMEAILNNNVVGVIATVSFEYDNSNPLSMTFLLY